jgi:hypothetical protein
MINATLGASRTPLGEVALAEITRSIIYRDILFVVDIKNAAHLFMDGRRVRNQ